MNDNRNAETVKSQIKDYLNKRKLDQARATENITYDESTDIYLGALMKYNKTNCNISAITSIDQKPFTISTNDETCTENQCRPAQVQTCTLSSVRDQIKNMITSMKKCPSKFMAQIYQFNSISELEIKTGISFQAGTICRFLNTLTLEANHYNTCAIIIMTNQNFTVDVDYQN